MIEYNPKILIASSIAKPTIKQAPVQATKWAGSDATVPAASRMGWSAFVANGVDSDADENSYAFDLFLESGS